MQAIERSHLTFYPNPVSGRPFLIQIRPPEHPSPLLAPRVCRIPLVHIPIDADHVIHELRMVGGPARLDQSASEARPLVLECTAHLDQTWAAVDSCRAADVEEGRSRASQERGENPGPDLLHLDHIETLADIALCRFLCAHKSYTTQRHRATAATGEMVVLVSKLG